MKLRRNVLLLISAGLLALPLPLFAQAFTPPAGVGAVTIGWQYIDNTGHRFTDGFLIKRGESVTASTLLDVDYGVSDRLSLSAGVPYVFAKYTGFQPGQSGLPHDLCACWRSSFQDLSVGARYRFGTELWAITPGVRYVLPTHDYPYRGEAVVGRNLEEAQASVNASLRLPGVLRRMTIDSGYTYSFVEKPLPGISINKSTGQVGVGYALTERLFVQVTANGLYTHGGLRLGSPTGDPFFPPGEVNTPERRAQRDRIIGVRQWQAGAGLAYATNGPIDIFAGYSKYIWGQSSHDGHVYNAGMTWYFETPPLLR